LKFGHRGQNKPCIDRRNNQVYVTSQNHGYGIDPKTLGKSGFKIWFENADDDTVEGIEHKSKPIIAVQFHPEASPGPYDCMYVFDRFKEVIANGVTPEPAAKPRVKKAKTKKTAAKKKKKGVKKGAKR
jgi:carbamoyl-phosphate synthase small subunit